jgi:hypothetical protein
MTTEQELNFDILRISTAIEMHFPQLVKYIGVTPVNTSGGQERNLKNLSDYRNSINAFLINYQRYHSNTTN